MDVFNLCASISLNADAFNSNLDKAQKKFKSFSDNISGLSGKIDSVYSGMGDVIKPAVDGFKAVESVGKKTENLMKKAAQGFGVVSTAVGGFGVSAVKSGMAFDSSISAVAAISGATGDEFDALRNKALEMGAKTKFSASEAADAMTYMGMAGWKTEDMLGGIAGIMNLAAASGEDLASTSDIVTNALTAFGMKASESGHFADILASASSNANTDVHMMGESFKYAAPVMGTLGYSAEDTAVALGLMGNAGIQASMAGTSLKTAMLNMASPTKAMAGVMSQYGISLTDTNGEMYSLGEVMTQLRDKMGGLDETTKAAAASTLFGKEAATGMLAIINAAPEDFDKLTTAINECNGAAEKMSSIMEDNLQGDITKLGSAFESLQIAISDSLTPTLREFAQFGQKAMAKLLEGFQGNGVSGFMDALSGIVADGVKMLAEKAPEFAHVAKTFIWHTAEGLLNAKDDILKAGNQIMLDLVGGLQTFPMYHGEQLRELGSGIIELVAQGFSMAGEAISWHIGEFVPLIAQGFLAYHETLFTVGMDILGAIGQGIIDNKDGLQDMASKTITNMVTALRDNAPAIIEGGLALLEALVGAIEENLPLIIETGAQIVGQLIAGISTASPGVQAIIAAAVLPHILRIIEVVGNIGGAVSNVSSLVGGAINTIIGIGGKLMGGVKALFGLIAANPVVAIITGIIATVVLLYTKCEWFRDAVHAVIDAVAGFFQGAWDLIVSVWEAAGDFFGGIVDGIKSVFEGIGEFLGGLFKAAWEAVQGAWDAAVDFFSGIWEGIQAVFSVVADVLGGFFSAAWDAIRAVWDTVLGVFQSIADGIHAAFEAVTSFLSEAFSAAWNAITGVWDAAVGFFSGVWDGITGVFGAVSGWFGDMFSRAWDAVTSAWSGVTDFFGGVWDNIKGVFSNAWEAFSDIGGNIVKGIWNGITGLADWLWGKVSGFFGGIVDGVKGMLGIASPSKVFAGIGGYMAEGLGKGWDDEYAGIKRQIESGLNFGTASIGVNANYSGASRYNAQDAAGRPVAGWGNTYVTINSPESVDGVQAAKVWKKEMQKMAIAYV